MFLFHLIENTVIDLFSGKADPLAIAVFYITFPVAFCLSYDRLKRMIRR